MAHSRPPPERRRAFHPRRSDLAAAASPGSRVSPWVGLRSATMHPFIYKRMVDQVDPAARPGDVVNVYDRDGQLFARGLFNPRSQIAVRVLMHMQGGPGGTPEGDDAFWQAKIASAVALRRLLRIEEQTDAYRLIHAEGDGLSGLIAERYGDCIAFEVFSLGIFQRIERITNALIAALGPPARLERPDLAAESWRVIVRADERVEEIEGFRVPRAHEGAPASTIIREHGIRYRVDLAGGHKTGFFCDQRENRRRIGGMCRDAEVLDLCCYTGGFSLCAKVLGGARSVTAVDLDEAALAIARENANLNQARIDFAHADAFNYLRQMLAIGRQFDVVVLDPPKLANSREGLEEALIKYNDLNFLAQQAVRPGGILITCSCSGLVSHDMFAETVQRAARRSRRTIQMLDYTGAGPDHPILLNCPESGYLKVMWARVL